MGTSDIEWCDLSSNVVDGCSPASPGCLLCWASYLWGTRHNGLTVRLGPPAKNPTLPVVDGVGADLVEPGRTPCGNYVRHIYKGRVALNDRKLAQALKTPKNGGRRHPRNPDGSCDHSRWEPVGNRVFWNHRSDTFHERLTFEEIAAQFAVMAARPDMRFLVLTKRPERALEFFAWLDKCAAAMLAWYPHDPLAWRQHQTLMRSYDRTQGAPMRLNGKETHSVMGWAGIELPLPNVAIGVSAEDQKRWDERVPLLLQIPAVMRFVSVEPMIGPVVATPEQLADIDQVIIGAESGYGAREPEIEWPQKLAAQVLDAQVWDTPQAPNPDPEMDGYIEVGPHQLVSGPALFLKQWPVCEHCSGHGGSLYDREAFCGGCEGDGQGAKLRKNCPEFYVNPKYGSQKWEQCPEGWAK